MRQLQFVLALAGLMGVGMLGCQPAKTTPPPAKNGAAEHGHADEHPAHGPNGGHVFELDGADFLGEGVMQKGNNLVSIFIIDSQAKKNLPVKADKIIVKTTLAGGKSFELAAVKPDADGQAYEFSLDDADLHNLATTEPVVEITVGDKTYSGKLDVHEMN